MNKTTRERREARKLQVTGDQTYIVSLPKKWIQKRGLKKGSRLDLTENDDGSIVLMPEGMQEVDKLTHATIEVEPNEDTDFVIRKIVSTYLVGYNVIFLRAKEQRLDLPQRNAIKEFTRRMLVGTEIIMDSPKEVMVRVLLSYPELSVQSVLRRMSIISVSMHKDAIAALKNLDEALAQEVIGMDDEVDRFSLYIIRQLKSAVEDERVVRDIGLEARRDCLGYRLIAKAVERTADHAVEMAENVLMLKIPPEKEIYDQIESMSALSVSVFEETIDILFKRDFELANRIVRKAKQVAASKKEMMKYASKMNNVEDVSSLSLIIESITRAVEYASDIAEIVLNLNIAHVLDA